MKRLLAMCAAPLAVAAIAFSPGCAPQPAQTTQASEAMPLPPITIYHLEGRRSERIVWMMEELGADYELVFERGDLAASMANIRELSPIVPMAPTVQYGDQVLVESGAIMETILDRHFPGQLQPALDSEDYPYHLMWMHFAEGSMAARLFSDYRFWSTVPTTERSPLVDSQAVVEFAEDYLGRHPWFGGAEFSSADIMMWFPLNVATALNLVDEELFPNVADWKARIEARPAFQRMRAVALPDGMVGSLQPIEGRPATAPR
jgi:glutathione S-transferase